MTLKEFNKLSLARRSDLVWEWAFYLTNCKYGNFNVVIFSFADFYVEMCINIRENKTERILALRADELHNDYVSAIRRAAPHLIREHISVPEASKAA
jgi:hypothetical protein